MHPTLAESSWSESSSRWTTNKLRTLPCLASLVTVKGDEKLVTHFTCMQNRRQKVFNRVFTFVQGAWHSKIWQKLHWFTVLHNSIWGAWSLFGGLRPPKPPVATGMFAWSVACTKSTGLAMHIGTLCHHSTNGKGLEEIQAQHFIWTNEKLEKSWSWNNPSLFLFTKTKHTEY